MNPATARNDMAELDDTIPSELDFGVPKGVHVGHGGPIARSPPHSITCAPLRETQQISTEAVGESLIVRRLITNRKNQASYLDPVLHVHAGTYACLALTCQHSGQRRSTTERCVLPTVSGPVQGQSG